MNKQYTQETEWLMQLYYLRLLEKEKRYYAALKARNMGNGGKKYIGRLLKISQKTAQRKAKGR